MSTVLKGKTWQDSLPDGSGLDLAGGLFAAAGAAAALYAGVPGLAITDLARCEGSRRLEAEEVDLGSVRPVPHWGL